LTDGRLFNSSIVDEEVLKIASRGRFPNETLNFETFARSAKGKEMFTLLSVENLSRSCNRIGLFAGLNKEGRWLATVVT